MKKAKVIIPICIFFAIIVCYFVSNYINTQNIKQLAEFGEAQFLANDFEAFLNDLRKQGLGDLSATVSFQYDKEYDYEKDTKTLLLTCNLEKLHSDEIDKYFTTEYNGSDGRRLGILLEKIKNACAFEHTYSTPSGETVHVKIYKPRHYLTIYSSSGHIYEYSFDFIDTVTVEIDGDWVYYGEEYTVESKPKGTHMPYVGMAESDIATTILGEPTTKEKCKDFYSLKASHRWTEYRWYEGNIQDLEHLKCIVKIWYYDHETKMEVPGYAYDVIIYD